METNELLKYLSIIIDLEKNKMVQEKTIRKLNKNISSFRKEYDTNIALNKKVDEQSTVVSNQKNIIVDTSGKGWMYFMVYFVGCLAVYSGSWIYNFTHKALLSTLVGLFGVIIGGSIPVAVWKNIIKKRKERALIQINRGNRADMELKERREIRNEELANIISKLNAENNAMQETYQQTCLSLKQCYDVNIIPAKYRNFIPVCMFYDYIFNKRTYSLERNTEKFDEGAINMYEQELRDHIIIGKLNTAINRIEDIRNNQETTYNAIFEVNQQTYTLLDSINNNINNNIKQINDNLSTIQYQNEQQLKCNEYLAYVASKYHYGY